MVQDFVHQQDIGCSEFRFYISQTRCHTSFSARKELGTLSAIIFRKCRRLSPSRFWSENFDFEMTEENKTCSGPRFPRFPMNKVQDSRTSPRFFGTLSGSCLCFLMVNRRILAEGLHFLVEFLRTGFWLCILGWFLKTDVFKKHWYLQWFLHVSHFERRRWRYICDTRLPPGRSGGGGPYIFTFGCLF